MVLTSSLRLGDTYGRKRMFIIGMTSFIITSAVCASAQSPLTLIVTRVFQGTAAALMFPQALYNSHQNKKILQLLYTVLLLVLLRLQDKSLVAFL
jgi:MFS family permease